MPTVSAAKLRSVLMINSQSSQSVFKTPVVEPEQHLLAGASLTPPPNSTKVLSNTWRANGIVFFTHIRRTSGTVLEYNLLLPFIAQIREGRSPVAFNCREGLEGRFQYALDVVRQRISNALGRAILSFRHCPHGLHTLISPQRSYTYITVVRRPLERMISWYQFCNSNSKNGNVMCGLSKVEWKMVRNVTAFYTRRDERASMTLLNIHTQAWQTHLTPQLEFIMDDNYQTRMLCGRNAFSPIPVGKLELECALDNMQHMYSFVGLTEHAVESACLLASMMGLQESAHFLDFFNSTKQHLSTEIPSDFELAHSWKATQDARVYDVAASMFARELKRVPVCMALGKRKVAVLAKKEKRNVTLSKSITAY